MIFTRIFHEKFQTEEEDERLRGKPWSRSLSLYEGNYQYVRRKGENYD